MGKIFANKSLNDGYRYIWDEATKFIIYQNNKGDIILGTINHEGQIKEREIEKLYKLELKDFGIYISGSGRFINYKGTIYIQNFKQFANLENYGKIQEVLKKLLYRDPNINYIYDCIENEIIHYYNATINIDRIYHGEQKYPQYWSLEQDTGKETAMIIEDIIFLILSFFYNIGITRKKLDTYETYREIEDCENMHLFEVIHQKFIDNNFKILEEPKLTIEDVYEKAQKENKNYDKIIRYLNQYNNKFLNETNSIEDTKEASKMAILYYRIVGKPYLFKEKIYEAHIENLKLSRIKQEN